MAASLLGWKSVLVGKTSRMTWNGWDDPTKMERLKTLVITTRRPPSPFVVATWWRAASVCANRTWLKIAEAVDLLDPRSFSGKHTYVSSNILVWILFFCSNDYHWFNIWSMFEASSIIQAIPTMFHHFHVQHLSLRGNMFQIWHCFWWPAQLHMFIEHPKWCN